MIFGAAVLFSFLGSTYAACDNSCSGHGTCNTDDVCQCYDNWGVGLSHDSADCSERICPFEIAWVDTPDVNGNFHKYMECAGRGICQRDTGECACFDGYEGKACQRSSCPNDCSGHGTCEYIEDLTYAATWNDFTEYGLYVDSKTFPYHDWDRRKERSCVCDPLYGDFDCSKRMCPYGNDVLDVSDNFLLDAKYQVQQILFNFPKTLEDNIDGKTFAISFKSKLNETFTTIPIVFDYDTTTPDFTDLVNDINMALLKLPNKVIDGVRVAVSEVATVFDYVQVNVTVTFTGNSVQGKQNLLIIHRDVCADGCTPKLSGLPVDTRGETNHSTVIELERAFYNSYECGRRGKCDYSTGLCQCFSGYTGDNCNTLHALF